MQLSAHIFLFSEECKVIPNKWSAVIRFTLAKYVVKLGKTYFTFYTKFPELWLWLKVDYVRTLHIAVNDV